ncbi:MAG: ice-binding family protein [Helicobacteraceae bacterium]|nr:ice-binding family protein [Helicobacteraceae bacterium]
MSIIIRKSVISWVIPIMVSVFISGCGVKGDPILGLATTTTTTPVIGAPTVVAVVPVNNETNVSLNIQSITAEFSMPMDSATLTTSSFWLSDANLTTHQVEGNVTYANKLAELNVTANLLSDSNYTVTITTDATSAAGIALANNYVWNFTTGSTADTTPPEVKSTSPRNGDINVSVTKTITATFSEAMKPLSITATTPSTFSVMETNTSTNVDGNGTYSVINKIASFNPDSNLSPDTNCTAIITTVAKDLAGNAMLNDYNWTFVTASASVTPPLVDLGLAAPYGIASTAGITNTVTAPNTLIDGNVVFNPTATCNGVQILYADGPGFGLCDGKAPSINGDVITPLYPDTITAQPITDDLRAAYISIRDMTGGTIAAPTSLGATGSVMVEGDNYFRTGVYKSGTSIDISGDLTLDAQGDPDATFVFQAGSHLTTTANTRILLVGGAKASNVYWQVGSSATLGTGTEWNGNILAYASITMVTGASSCGRLFAGAFTDGAFVFDSNHVSVPGNASAPAGCE